MFLFSCFLYNLGEQEMWVGALDSCHRAKREKIFLLGRLFALGPAGG